MAYNPSDLIPYDVSGIGGVFSKSFVIGFWSLVVLGILFTLFIWIKNKRTYKTPVTLVILEQNNTYKEQTNLIGGVFKKRSGIRDFKIKIPRQFAKKWLGYTPDFSLADSGGRLSFLRVGDGTVWQQLNRNLILNKDIEQKVEEVWYKNKSTNEEFNLNDLQEDIKNNLEQITKEDEETKKDKVIFKFIPTQKEYVLIDELINENYETFNKEVLKKIVNYSLISEPIPTDVKTVTINNIHDAQNILEKNKLTAWSIGIGAFVIMALTQIIFIYLTNK